jgi:hypothetical protein
LVASQASKPPPIGGSPGHEPALVRSAKAEAPKPAILRGASLTERDQKMTTVARLNEIIEALRRRHLVSRRLIDAEVEELCAAYPDVPRNVMRACEIAARELELQEADR